MKSPKSYSLRVKRGNRGKMKRNIMFTVTIICALIILSLAGCAKKAAEPGAEVTPPAPAAPAAPGQEMKPGEGIPAGGPVVPAAGETVVFDKKIYFDFDKFDLGAEAIGALNELAAFLKANAGLKVSVEGHCDERGTNEYNLALGERRAKAAYDYLAAQGIDPSRLSTVSYGEEKPADPGQNEEAWAKNRRDEFVLSK